MDIYAVEKQEGRYLARELEKLREKKSRSRVAIKCNPTNNEQINRFRKAFLLESGTSNVFEMSDRYYITIDTQALTLTIIYDVCHIIYHLRKETDWKYIELEIVDSKFCQNIVPNKTAVAGRAEVTAFHILVSHSIAQGLYNTFHLRSGTLLSEIFEKISNADELKKADFGLEAKITSMILKMT